MGQRGEFGPVQRPSPGPAEAAAVPAVPEPHAEHLRAVREFDLQLREGSKLISVESAASTPGQASTKPTIPESESEN